MALPRKRQISLADTPYYHCVSRCVRRAYLCGEDSVTGHSYEHRRQWVEDRLLLLASLFTIDVCAYAVMSNHTHVVLHVDKGKAMSMSDEEVARRWRRLHRTPVLVQRFADTQQQPLCQLEQLTLQDTLSVYRARLCDISWFMRELNEFIARQANREDDCTGHFWEGRFKSQALLDEQALAACMVYVDLNPIRAAMAYSPETSQHTSIKRRLECAKQDYQPAALLPFAGNLRADSPKGLPFALVDYLQLVDDSHRIINSSARDDADILSNPIMVDLRFNQSHWAALIQNFEQVFSVAAGTLTSLQSYKAHTQRKRITPTHVRL